MLKLLKYLKKYSTLVAFTVLLTFTQVILQLFLPTMMSDIIDKGLKLDVARSTEKVLYYSGDTPFILKQGGLMLIVALLSGAAVIGAAMLSSKASVGFGRDIRSHIFRRVESFSLKEFDKVGTASLITRSTNDVTQVQNVVIVVLRMMLMAPLMLIGGLIMAISKDGPLSRVLLITIPVLILSIVLIASKAMPLFKSIQKKLDKVNLVMRENLTGIRVVRAFNRDKYESKRFDGVNWDLTATSIRVNRIMALTWPLMMLIMNMTTVAVLWYGGHRIDQGAMQVGDLMAYVQYIMQIMFSLLMMTMMFIMIPRAAASAERINEVLAIEPEIVDKKDSREMISSHLQKGYVEFNNVSFTYQGAEVPAVQGISFKVGPGETTAIIGGTGSGKTTLINLIQRFYDPGEGTILVDQMDIKEMGLDNLRNRIGYVPQKAVLFTGTVRENLAYAREDASQEELIKAIETAQAEEFINSLEGGLEGVISQGGVNLSGGQKQRLSIARALLRRPEIYLFDDSFSALDFKTDGALRAALKKETAGATVIIVAQRVSTVMKADRIIVLDEGKIAGMGTHRELYESCPVYKEIVLSQLTEEEAL
jgi:ATP-binding cassette subfamily B multidrug efflux pump